MNIGNLRSGQHVQHCKGGKYVIIGVGKLEWDVDRKMVVYRPINDYSLWIRPLEEFLDGRFTLVEEQLG